MKDLKTMGYYFNVTRTDQVVQIIDLKKDKVWYQVIRQYDQNTITEFFCTRERFNNLYLPKQ